MSLNGTASPFNPQDWLASNFSSQHHCWFKSSSQEIKGNDHHLKKIMIMRHSPCQYHRKCIGTVGRIWKWELGTHRLMIIFQELNRTSKENDQREQQRHHRVLLQKNLRRELRRSSKKHNQAQKKKYFWCFPNLAGFNVHTVMFLFKWDYIKVVLWRRFLEAYNFD